MRMSAGLYMYDCFGCYNNFYDYWNCWLEVLICVTACYWLLLCMLAWLRVPLQHLDRLLWSQSLWLPKFPAPRWCCVLMDVPMSAWEAWKRTMRRPQSSMNVLDKLPALWGWLHCCCDVHFSSVDESWAPISVWSTEGRLWEVFYSCVLCVFAALSNQLDYFLQMPAI